MSYDEDMEQEPVSGEEEEDEPQAGRKSRQPGEGSTLLYAATKPSVSSYLKKHWVWWDSLDVETDRLRAQQFWSRYEGNPETEVLARTGRSLAEARLNVIKSCNAMNNTGTINAPQAVKSFLAAVDQPLEDIKNSIKVISVYLDGNPGLAGLVASGSNSCDLERRDILAMKEAAAAARGRGGGPVRRGGRGKLFSGGTGGYYTPNAGYNGNPPGPYGPQVYGPQIHGPQAFGPPGYGPSQPYGSYQAPMGFQRRGGAANNRIQPTGDNSLLQLLVQQLAPKEKQPVPSAAGKGCFACGEADHWARNCPSSRH